jgi:peptidylprolyl isomerase
MSKNIMPLLIVLVVVGIGITGIFLLSNQKSQTPDLNVNPNSILQPTSAIISTPVPQVTGEQNMDNVITKENGLKIQDITVGNGAEVKSGDKVTVNYLGTLENGTKFDSSYDRGTPFTTQIGVGQVIQGWDEGIVGMKVGGKRKLIIPASLGYGDQQAGDIPPGSTLIFEVELLNVTQ